MVTMTCAVSALNDMRDEKGVASRSAHLGFPRQHPVKHAVDVGLDVLGVLTARYHSHTSLHIPLQAHLHFILDETNCFGHSTAQHGSA